MSQESAVAVFGTLWRSHIESNVLSLGIDRASKRSLTHELTRQLFKW